MNVEKIWDVEKILRDEKAGSVLLVCGNSFRGQKLYEELKGCVEASGVRLTEFSDFTPNPAYESVEKGIEAFREQGCDFIIAAGGGSR